MPDTSITLARWGEKELRFYLRAEQTDAKGDLRAFLAELQNRR